MTTHSASKKQHLMYRIMGILPPSRDSNVEIWAAENCCFVLTQNASADRFWPGRATFVANHLQIIAVIALRQLVDDFGQTFFVNETHPQGDLFETRHLESLSMFDRGDVVAGFEQTGLCSSIEPGHPSTEQLHMQLILFEIEQI